MNIDLGILLGVFALVGLFSFIYFACKADNAKYAKMLKDDQDWLAAEMKKPLYRIAFYTSGDRYGGYNATSIMEPYNTLEGCNWNIRRTSKSQAESHLAACYERGYFRNTAGDTYPTCNIQTAKIEEVNLG